MSWQGMQESTNSECGGLLHTMQKKEKEKKNEFLCICGLIVILCK